MTRWYSAGISNPSRDRVWVRILALCKKKKRKITGRHLGVMTWVWPGPLRVSEIQGRNTCYKGDFFSEDSLLSSSPMSFYLLRKFDLFAIVSHLLSHSFRKSGLLLSLLRHPKLMYSLLFYSY